MPSLATRMALTGLAAAVAAAVIAASVSAAPAQAQRYCEKPDHAGAMLAASTGVSCRTAERVKAALISLPCSIDTQCFAQGFRCVAYFNGAFGISFANASHALCSDGWKWIVWDGG